jgi:hypothetical protein
MFVSGLCVVNIQTSATGRSLVQGNPTKRECLIVIDQVQQ